VKQLTILENGIVREATSEELREITMRFLFGVCVGELHKLGISDDEIRETLSISLAALSDRSVPS
jgi:hypothetical protein